MSFESLTDEDIRKMIEMPKIAEKGEAKEKDKEGHIGTNWFAVAKEDKNIRFSIYKRRSSSHENDYSCGLAWIAPNGECLTLTRYNGNSHPHTNHHEKEKFEDAEHIHVATERYIRANKKAEGFAEKTGRYDNVDKAFECLLEDCRVEGIKVERQLRLIK
jgi:hypothetical protein